MVTGPLSGNTTPAGATGLRSTIRRGSMLAVRSSASPASVRSVTRSRRRCARSAGLVTGGGGGSGIAMSGAAVAPPALYTSRFAARTMSQMNK